MRPTKLRAKFFQQPRIQQQFVLNQLRKSIELNFEFLYKTNSPSHYNITLRLLFSIPSLSQKTDRSL